MMPILACLSRMRSVSAEIGDAEGGVTSGTDPLMAKPCDCTTMVEERCAVRSRLADENTSPEIISMRGHAGGELFGPVERHLDLKRRTVRLQHQEVLAIGHHGKT